MPSGAKRRKAAKKKKEIETLNGDSSSSANPQGDEGKSADERGSGNGLVGSKPVAKEWRPDSRGKYVESDSSDAEAKRKDGGVKLERHLKKGSKRDNHAGSGKESSKSSSSSSSSSISSSDDESGVVGGRRKEKGNASASEEKPTIVSVEKPAVVSELKPSMVSEEKPASVSKGKPADVSEGKAAAFSEGNPVSDFVQSVGSLLGEMTHSGGDAPAKKTTRIDEEKTHSPDYEIPVAPVPRMTVHITETTQVDGLVISGTVVQPATESGEEKNLPTGDSESLSVSLPEKIETMVTPMPNENDQASPTKEESVCKENGSTVLPSLSASLAQASNDAGPIQEIPAYSETQPLVAPAPRVVEKTSCFGCCGILEVITGSRR